MTNRRLVPTPTESRRSDVPPAPVAAIAPSGLRAWHCFAFLIVAATIWYAAKGPLIVIGLLAGFFWSLNWLCHRSPRTMHWIVLIVEGLMKRPAKALGKRAPGASVHPGESLARELPCQQRPIVSVQHARYHGDGCRQHLGIIATARRHQRHDQRHFRVARRMSRTSFSESRGGVGFLSHLRSLVTMS